MKEIFRPVAGFEGRYEVGDQGNVRSLSGSGKLRGSGFLRPHKVGTGYLHVGFCVEQRRSWFLVHRLVYAAFVGSIPDGMTVNHKDGDILNNAPGNLDLMTPQEQIIHKNEVLRRKPVGEQHKSSKLTEQQVREIRARRGSASQSSIARDYGVTQGLVGQIQRRKVWAHVH